MSFCVRWNVYSRSDKGEAWFEDRKEAMALIATQKKDPDVSNIDLTTYDKKGFAQSNWNWSRLSKGSRTWEKARFA